MANMVFEVYNSTPGNVTFNWANRRAAKRQTERQRSEIFAKYQSMVGLPGGFKNMLAARRAAFKELEKLPEYWNEDTTPRRPLTPSSSAIRNVRTFAGGCFIQFRNSGPSGEKWYWYPCGGTREATAKAVEKLITGGGGAGGAASIGKYYNRVFGKRNAMKSRITKTGEKKYIGKMLHWPK